jgi:long-subunit fatty acid transport protein
VITNPAGMTRLQGDELMLAGQLLYGSAGFAANSQTSTNGDAWRFAVGGQYQLKENMFLGLGYSFQWMGDLDLDVEGGPLTGRLAGTNENTNIHFFALNLRMSF